MATTLVASGTLGNVPNATGQSNQSHLVYGVNSARWFLFFVDATNTTKVDCYVSSSNDLSTATWAAIGTGALSPALNASNTWVANEGRNLAVAYANIGSTDVVYIVASTSKTGAVHVDIDQAIRATVTSSTATWGTWASVSTGGTVGGANTPSGSAAAISTTSRAWIVDSRLTEDNDWAAAIASNTDSGASWTAGWGAATALDNSMANVINSGAVLPLASGLMLGLADTGVLTDSATGNKNVLFVKSSSATAWPANAARSKVFAADTATGQWKNDWAAVGVSTSDIHVVRRATSTTFDHRRTSDGVTWGTLVTISATGLTGHLANSGIHLATDGTSVWMFVIDTDANKNIKYLQWTSGGGWDAAWSTLSTSDTNTKANISGFQQAGNSQIGVVWTENASTPFAVVGSFLSLTAAAASLPPGVQVVAPTPLSLSPRLPDNRTFAVSHYQDTSPPPKMPPGIPIVTAAAVPPHAGDNWTWLESVYPGMAPPVQPPGQQIVLPTAAALSPRATDNWSFAVSHYPETSPPPPLPPGATYTAPGATQQPGPTIALAGLTQPPPTPLPAGQQVVTPAAIAPHAGDNWTFSQSHYPGIAPLPLPPGAQITTPAATPPHAADNWSQVVSVYLGMAAATLPPGLQFVAPTAAALAPRATDNWSFSVAHYNSTSPPPPLPAGQQVVAPAAIAPHLGDNWTLVQPGQQHVILLIAPPGVQVVTPAARPPHAGDNWTAVQPGLTQAVNALPPGAQAITPAAIPPHTADNWTLAHAGLTQPPPTKMPPGQQVTNYVLVWQQAPNYTFLAPGLTQPAAGITGYGSGLYGAGLYSGSGVFTGYGSGLYGAGIYSGESASQVPGLQIVVPPPFRTHAGDNYSFSVSHPPFFLSPPPPLPPGLQIVTPAAIPPHLGDNWTRALAGLTQPAPSKLPPGQQSVTYIPSIGNRNIDWSWMPPNTTARMLDEDPLFPVSPLGPLTAGGISTLTARAGGGISTLSPRGPFAISELTEDEALS